MSEAASALPGAEFAGFVTVREMGLQGMVTLRGDLSSGTLQQAVSAAAGHGVPSQRSIAGGLGGGVAWMSPDELMLFCAYDKAEELAALLGQALAGEHHLALNVSDARAVFALEGAAVRDVMAKLAPVDFAAGQFEPGEIRRSRLAQIPAAFWMPTPDSFHLVCFRSVAQYTFDLLSTAAAPGGEVT